MGSCGFQLADLVKSPTPRAYLAFLGSLLVEEAPISRNCWQHSLPVEFPASRVLPKTTTLQCLSLVWSVTQKYRLSDRIASQKTLLERHDSGRSEVPLFLFPPSFLYLPLYFDLASASSEQPSGLILPWSLPHPSLLEKPTRGMKELITTPKARYPGSALSASWLSTECNCNSALDVRVMTEGSRPKGKVPTDKCSPGRTWRNWRAGGPEWFPCDWHTALAAELCERNNLWFSFPELRRVPEMSNDLLEVQPLWLRAIAQVVIAVDMTGLIV